MANEVYANGNEIACKAGAGKTICAMPDVCFTPPENPATPPGVPVPYPNTGFASDTTEGSKTVKISDKEIMLKNKSYFKKSVGDEAGAAAKKGMISSTNTGKVYFIKWSMNVKFEGENVDRHFDMTTDNHASPGANEAVPWPFTDNQVISDDSECAGDKEKKDKACKGKKEPHCPGVLSKPTEWLKEQMKKKAKGRDSLASRLDSTDLEPGNSRSSKAAPAATKEANSDNCVKKSRCQLKPFKPTKKQPKCCPGQTPHHIPPKACFKGGARKKYDKNKALCVCMEGTSQHYGSHGKNHAAIDYLASKKVPKLKHHDRCSIADYNQICAAAVAAQCGCNAKCIEQQLNESLKPTDRQIRHVHSTSIEPVEARLKSKLSKAYDALSGITTGR